MKITRSKLSEIVESEVRRALAEEDDGGKKKKKGSSSPDVASADDEPTKPQAAVPGPPPVKGPDASPGDPPTPADGDKDPSAEPDGDGPDPAAIDADGTGGEEPSGAINNDISGKSVQALAVEPKSKVLPGAKEVVVTFSDTTDALRILVTPTGAVRFFFRGQLHDLP